MKTLVIYDSTGHIYLQMAGNYTIPAGGIQYLEEEVPEGKLAVKVDTTVTPNVPIYEDRPETLEVSMKDLKKDNELLKGCVMELANVVYSSATTANGNGV